MKNNVKFMVIVLVVAVAVAGYLVMNKNKMVSEPQYEDGVMVTAPEEVIDNETGEVDQAAFEESQAVSKDDSIETIEAELDKTVILKEDFSDL
ncbi:MAG: hypothetical protein ABII80_01290 [bacterium]